MSSLPRTNQAGFTLVEALVSITILTVGLIPVFWQSTQALTLSVRVKNTMTASNLAQEGVELTRAIRDTNWLEQLPTWQGMDGCGVPNGCEISFDEPALARVAGTPRFLLFAPTTGLYQYSTTGQQTAFTRVITVSTGAIPDERIITSKVSWTEHGTTRDVTLEYHLFDWLQ